MERDYFIWFSVLFGSGWLFFVWRCDGDVMDDIIVIGIVCNVVMKMVFDLDLFFWKGDCWV